MPETYTCKKCGEELCLDEIFVCPSCDEPIPQEELMKYEKEGKG